MHKRLKPLLVCPKCKGPLEQRSGSRQLFCPRDNLIFPVRNGVPVLLEMDAIESTINDDGAK